MSSDVSNPVEYRGGLRVTAEQAAIVDHVCDAAHGITVVDAGAGSGKTYTTVATVLEILEQDQDATIDRFVLITFTRKAAEELRKRIEGALLERVNGATGAARERWTEARERLSSAYVGTIHGFCRKILREFGHGALVARESEIGLAGRALLGDALAHVFDAELRKNPDHPLLGAIGEGTEAHEIERLVREIHDDLRNRGRDPHEVERATHNQAGDPGKPLRVAMIDLVCAVHDEYERRKVDANRIDSADLLLRTAEVLEAAAKGEPAILEKIARRHRWVFVDEFQDTDCTQERIVEALLPRLRGVLLVGDVKQSIYAFRGAGIDLREIAKRHHVPLLPLSISRRPTDALLDAQNALFAVVGRSFPSLDSPLQPPEKPVVATTKIPPMIYVDAGRLSGPEATARVISGLLEKNTRIDTEEGTRALTAGDIAVLFRANHALDEYEAAMEGHLRQGIAARRDEGGQFFARPEIVAVCRLLHLVLDHPNELALALALQTPYLRALRGDRPERAILTSGRLDAGDIAHWFSAQHPKEEQRVRELQEMVRAATVPELMEHLYRRFGLREHHLARKDHRAVDNIERLREMARMLTDSEDSLTARVFLSWLRARILGGHPEPDAGDGAQRTREDVVRLMTVHRAKGLEFPVVILPEVDVAIVGSSFSQASRFLIHKGGLDLQLTVRGVGARSPGWQGNTRVDDDVQRREAMRVFYVAVTRARNHVVFVGGESLNDARDAGHPRYGWRDEIARAWSDLDALGAKTRRY